MARIHTDLSRVPISVAPNTATAGTSLGVTDANAAYLPNTYPYWAVIVPTGASPTRANSEIVKVTAGSSSGGTTTLTIIRAQGIPVTTAKTVTTDFDIYEAVSSEHASVINSGWIPVGDSWAYASATTITVPAGAGSLYQKGDKIYLVNNSYKYFYIVTVADTLLTVTGEEDLANVAITAIYYSKSDNPQGFKKGEIYYKARAHATATQALSANTAATLTCGAEDYDINSNYNTGTYVYTAPISGYYRITGRCKGANLAANERIYLTTVGGTGGGSGTDVQATGTGSYIAAQVSNIVYAAKGTGLYIQVSTTGGADTQYDDSTSIWVAFEFISI